MNKQWAHYWIFIALWLVVLAALVVAVDRRFSAAEQATQEPQP